MSSNVLKRQDFLYTAAYCEENIWHLCQTESFKNSYVIFIACKGEYFPMLNQRAAKDPLSAIFWDYHVVLLTTSVENRIIDFDTSLPFSSDIRSYLELSFFDSNQLNKEYAPLFRLISCKEYSARFSSDRSHMKTKTGWLATPPNWPTIGNENNNLEQFTDMKNRDIGEILTLDDLLERYS